MKPAALVVCLLNAVFSFICVALAAYAAHFLLQATSIFVIPFIIYAANSLFIALNSKRLVFSLAIVDILSLIFLTLAAVLLPPGEPLYSWMGTLLGAGATLIFVDLIFVFKAWR